MLRTNISSFEMNTDKRDACFDLVGPVQLKVRTVKTAAIVFMKRSRPGTIHGSPYPDERVRDFVFDSSLSGPCMMSHANATAPLLLGREHARRLIAAVRVRLV